VLTVNPIRRKTVWY